MIYRGEVVWEDTFEGETDSHFYHTTDTDPEQLFVDLMGYVGEDTLVQLMIKQQPE